MREVLLSEARYTDNLPQTDSWNSQLKKWTMTQNNCGVGCLFSEHHTDCTRTYLGLLLSGFVTQLHLTAVVQRRFCQNVYVCQPGKGMTNISCYHEGNPTTQWGKEYLPIPPKNLGWHCCCVKQRKWFNNARVCFFFFLTPVLFNKCVKFAANLKPWQKQMKNCSMFSCCAAPNTAVRP